jgi:TonB family protein
LPGEGVREHFRDSESDIAELFAKFEQNSGGTLSPQFSADLALEIVLNEIVEQACLATCATGAAVVLWRGNELVCRASIGASAPALGAQMDSRAGLSGLCIQTGLVQRCDDALTDARADHEASLRLGVRSVMVVPLARPTGVLGILEVFSAHPTAFGERDERTLVVLGHRVLRNVERAAQPFLLRADALPAPAYVPPRAVEEAPPPRPVFDAPLGGSIFGAAASTSPPRTAIDLLAGLMGLILLAGVILLGVRLTGGNWKLAGLKSEAEKMSSRVIQKQPDANVSGGGVSNSKAQPVPAQDSAANADPAAASVRGEKQTHPPGVPQGGLRVLENGREVFRQAASREGIEPEAPAQGSPAQGTKLIQLSPAAAEALLIHRVEPEYPESARAQNVQGQVILQIRIQTDGSVADVQVLSGDPLLAPAATDAVKQWKFKPRTGTGDSPEMQTRVTMNFRLSQ